MTIEELQNLAQSRGENALELAKEDEEKKRKVTYASRVSSLLKICNALRSTCSQFKKSIFLLPELNKILS